MNISGSLPPCQNCTVAINVPGKGFPFGSYYHTTLYVREIYTLTCAGMESSLSFVLHGMACDDLQVKH